MSSKRYSYYNVYDIGFSREETDNGITRIVEDETEFDVEMNDNTELLMLFGQFISENSFKVVAINYVEFVGIQRKE